MGACFVGRRDRAVSEVNESCTFSQQTQPKKIEGRSFVFWRQRQTSKTSGASHHMPSQQAEGTSISPWKHTWLEQHNAV